MVRGECQVMDLGQMEISGQKQRGPLDYMSEGKNILSWLLQSPGPLYLNTHFRRKLYVCKRGGFKHSKIQNLCGRIHPVIMPNAANSNVLFREVSDVLELVFVKSRFGSGELMVLSPGK